MKGGGGGGGVDLSQEFVYVQCAVILSGMSTHRHVDTGHQVCDGRPPCYKMGLRASNQYIPIGESISKGAYILGYGSRQQTCTELA